MYASLIGMKSLTYAMKAQRYLARKGINVPIERLPNGHRSGCGYCIRVFGQNAANGGVTRICSLLSEIGIGCDTIIQS